MEEKIRRYAGNKVSAEMGISRRKKTCETGTGSKGKSRTERSAAWGTGNNKVSDQDERIEVEPEWRGGNETKQGRQKKKGEKVTAKQNGEQERVMTAEWREERKTVRF